jgi:tetratricopeptide (TPR) repeat protein
MILAFVSNHLQAGPVYITLDIAGNREGQDSELTKSLISSYQLVPQGLVFEVTSDRKFKQPADLRMNTRGLDDGTIKFGNDDVVTLKVFPVYVNMFYNRGRYLAVNGRHDQAIEAFKQALSLNPGFAIAQQGLNESTVALGKGASGKPQ